MAKSKSIEDNFKRRTKAAEESQFIGIVQVKEILSMEKPTVIELINKGEIRATLYKGSWRTSRKEVMDFIERCLDGHIVPDIIHPAR